MQGTQAIFMWYKNIKEKHNNQKSHFEEQYKWVAEKKDKTQYKTVKNEFSTSETIQRDSSVRSVKFIPLSHHCFPKRKKSQDKLERWCPAQGQESPTAGKRNLTKSELLLWQSVGVERQDREGEDETSFAIHYGGRAFKEVWLKLEYDIK